MFWEGKVIYEEKKQFSNGQICGTFHPVPLKLKSVKLKMGQLLSMILQLFKIFSDLETRTNGDGTCKKASFKLLISP